MTEITRPLRPRAAADAPALRELDPVLARVYAARGVRDPAELDYGLANLVPVSSLENIEAAVELLLRHRDGRIVVVGDFDADGATSTAVMLRCLRAFGFCDVGYVVPNRFDYGYGLSTELVEVIAPREPSLIVTVDNGVSSIDGVSAARTRGIDVLVTDHHLPGERLPEANVMLNPNVGNDGFGAKSLAGVGVAFYLMAALGRTLSKSGDTQSSKVPATYLDLVALGTIADVVPLDRNNRILVEQGLKRIRAGKCVAGITALMRAGRRSSNRVTSSDLAFAVGPRLNAAGRLEDMSVGIECLLTDEAALAGDYAERLDQINAERRNIEATMREEALSSVDRIDAARLPACVSLFDPGWHVGVVGLVAARVKERYHRPVFAFACDKDNELKGSGRSVSGVHLRDLLEAVDSANPGLLIKYGGHAMAAGLSLKTEDFEQFRDSAARVMAKRYPTLDMSGAIVTDGVLPGEKLNREFAQVLRVSGPWGAGFPEPTFQGDFQVVDQRVVGENHLKLRVTPSGQRDAIDAIAFNQHYPGLRRDVRMAYRLDINEFRGIESAQLIVEQITEI